MKPIIIRWPDPVALRPSALHRHGARPRALRRARRRAVVPAIGPCGRASDGRQGAAVGQLPRLRAHQLRRRRRNPGQQVILTLTLALTLTLILTLALTLTLILTLTLTLTLTPSQLQAP